MGALHSCLSSPTRGWPAAARVALLLTVVWPATVIGVDDKSELHRVPGSVAVAHAQADPETIVDGCVLAEMDDRGIHGAQIAVALDGAIVFERAYGRKHRDRDDPVDIHTQFRIGSTTKTLTAFAIMQQVDAGKIDLDAPITTYLADFYLAQPGQAELISTRHLLTHSSGLHDTSAMDESDLFGPTDPGAMRRWVAEQRGSAPYAPPGRFWNYSSANYMYAGNILERVAAMSYPDYMDTHVFRPAGMLDTTLHAAQAVERGNFAYGHYNNPFSGRLEIYDLEVSDNWARHPTGYANSTAGDLVRFASLMMAGGGGLLTAESVDEMVARQQYRDLRSDQYYGLGTFVEYHGGREMVHHDGGAWGWSATMKWLPEVGLAVATTSNIAGGALSSATVCALDAYATPIQTPPSRCELDRSRWDGFVGTYVGSRNDGTRWVFHITHPDPDGDLRLRLEREGREPAEFTLRQDCSTWLNAGPGSFEVAGLGTITFVEDPVQQGVIWLRNRFFVGGMWPDSARTYDLYLPLLEDG